MFGRVNRWAGPPRLASSGQARLLVGRFARGRTEAAPLVRPLQREEGLHCRPRKRWRRSPRIQSGRSSWDASLFFCACIGNATTSAAPAHRETPRKHCSSSEAPLPCGWTVRGETTHCATATATRYLGCAEGPLAREAT